MTRDARRCVLNCLAEAHASAIFISAMLLTLVAVEVRELCRLFQISRAVDNFEFLTGAAPASPTSLQAYCIHFWHAGGNTRLPDSMDGLC